MALRRGDQYLNEAIAALDHHFEVHKGNRSLAWDSLGRSELEFVASEIEHCTNDAYYYLENYHFIRPENGLPHTLMFNQAQEIFWDHMRAEFERCGKAKLIVCKGRQLGISTLTQGFLFWRTIYTPVCNSLVVAQDPGQAGYLFDMSRFAYNLLPWWMRPEVQYEAKGKYLTLDRKDPEERRIYPGMQSTIYVEAGNKMCLSPGTKVPSARGLVAIETLKPGDFVYDKNYKPIKVVATIARRSKKKTGRKVVISHNQAFPVCGTDDHPVMTINGLRCLNELRKGNAVILPFRSIRKTGLYIPRVRMSRHARERLRHIPVPQPTREWGFLCGLYLAEGSVDKTNGHPVCFALHAREEHLARRASMACGIPLSSPIKPGNGLVYRIHSSWLGTWLSQQFGTKDEKHLPDWVFKGGRAFCLGLLEGILLGDGHFCEERNDVIFVSTRERLALQLRDLALALGLGLGAINKTKTAWKHNGIKKTGIGYRVEFGGESGISVRKALGIVSRPVKDHLRNCPKWGWMPRRESIWVEVKSNSPCSIDVVYDIQVDSEDHLYALPALITHNTGVAVGKTCRNLHASEIPKWGPQAGEILATEIDPTTAGAEDLFAVYESTSRGKGNVWHAMWVDAEAGLTDLHPIFIPPFILKKYSLPIEAEEVFERTEEEKGIAKKIIEEQGYDVTDEYLKWRRVKIADITSKTGDEWKFHQEYPNSAADSFQVSGICIFNKRKLQEILSIDCCRPVWYGEIYLEPKSLNSPKFPRPLVKVNPGDKLPIREKQGGRFWLWEPPDTKAEYYIGGDVAYGIEGRDLSVASVWRIGKGQQKDVQVAEWRGWVSPEAFGHILAAIGYWYNTCPIACEVNDCGKTTNNELFRVLGYPSLYQWKYLDKLTNIYSNFFGWQTNHKSKSDLISNTIQVIEGTTATFRSEPLVDEAMSYGLSSDGSGKVEGQGCHDDLIMAAMICLYCAHEMDWGNPRFNKDEQGGERREPVQFSETDYSPIHDKRGHDRELFLKNVPPEAVAEMKMYSEYESGETLDQDEIWKTW